MFDFQKCMVNSGTIIFTAFIRECDPDVAAFEHFLYLCTLYRTLVRADYTLLRLPWYVRSQTTNKENVLRAFTQLQHYYEMCHKYNLMAS